VVFSITTGSWPATIVIAQESSFGTWHEITYRPDVVRETDQGAECALCLRRVYASYLVRDHMAWKIWHLDCFEEDLTLHRETGEWKLRSLTWSAT
jgi:hypothetical protein